MAQRIESEEFGARYIAQIEHVPNLLPFNAPSAVRSQVSSDADDPDAWPYIRHHPCQERPPVRNAVQQARLNIHLLCAVAEVQATLAITPHGDHP